jgi:hypothetical protein
MFDQPGGLDDLLREIVKAGVNFTNAYGRSGYGNEKAYFVIDPENVTDAKEKLLKAGLNSIADEKVYGVSKS